MKNNINLPLYGINSIGDDAYFIRLNNDIDNFVHPEASLETKDEVGYVIKASCVGAAIFTKKVAKNFIMASGADNLEMVKVKDILGNDNSSN